LNEFLEFIEVAAVFGEDIFGFLEQQIPESLLKGVLDLVVVEEGHERTDVLVVVVVEKVVEHDALEPGVLEEEVAHLGEHVLVEALLVDLHDGQHLGLEELLEVVDQLHVDQLAAEEAGVVDLDAQFVDDHLEVLLVEFVFEEDHVRHLVLHLEGGVALLLGVHLVDHLQQVGLAHLAG